MVTLSNQSSKFLLFSTRWIVSFAGRCARLQRLSALFAAVLVYFRFTFSVAASFCAALFLAVPCRAVGEPMPLPDSAGSVDRASVYWRYHAGLDALKSGLPSLADGLFRGVIENELSPPDLVRDAQLKLVGALIEQRRLEDARTELQAIEPPYVAEYYLRRAVFFFYGGDLIGLEQDLEAIDPDALSSDLLPWYFLLNGVLNKRRGDEVAAQLSFGEAQRTSRGPVQQAQFEAIRISGEILAGQIDERSVQVLAQRVRQHAGSRVGIGFARQYAVTLHQLGRSEEAIAVLREQVNYLTTDETGEESQLQLLTGMIAGPDSSTGRLALIDVIGRAANQQIARVALYHLLTALEDNSGGEAIADFKNVLDRLLAQEDHPIRDELLLIRARLALRVGEVDQAATDAEMVVENFPNSAFREDALYLLAYLGWTSDPPRYRSAADYLGQLRSELPPGRHLATVTRLMADCFFLKGDFQTAATLYAEAFNSGLTSSAAAEVAYQQVLAQLEIDDFETAETLLDNETLFSGMPGLRWRAEWNLALKRIAKRQLAVARDRLAKLFERTANGGGAPALRLRFLWLRASLAYREADYASTEALARLALREAREHSGLDGVAASSLLLQGQSLLRLGRTEDAEIVFETLRNAYPGSEPSILSFFEEARFLASQFKLAEAQRRLSQLAERHPDDPNAPVALFEAALLAEKQGQARNLDEALALLDQFIERFPEHSLLFRVRLLQGDIARSLGEFGAAQNIYEEIMRNFDDDRFPVWLADLYAGNCLVAQSSRNPALLDLAAARFERLFVRSSLPVSVRAEAGFNFGNIYRTQGNTSRALEIFWMVLRRLLEAESVELDGQSRYWLARASLELGRLLEDAGKGREALTVYAIIGEYGLPGERIALGRSEAIRSPTRAN